jgi:hypothetical protein
MLEYLFAFCNAGTRDPALHRLYVEVLHLMKPACTAISPEVVERVKGL